MRYPPPVTLTGDPDERDYQSPQFVLGTLTSVVVAHDFICPWCYVGFFHAQRLMKEFGLTLDWRGFELMPPGMEFPPKPPKPVDPNAPPAPPSPPSRFDLFAEAEGLTPPTRPPFVRSHAALLGAEWALLEGGGAEAQLRYHEAVYLGYWRDGRDISDLTVLTDLAESAGMDGQAMAQSIREERHARFIVPYDDPAYSVGIRHVPTFIFGGEEILAEAEYTALTRATERFLVRRAKFQPASG